MTEMPQLTCCCSPTVDYLREELGAHGCTDPPIHITPSKKGLMPIKRSQAGSDRVLATDGRSDFSDVIIRRVCADMQ